MIEKLREELFIAGRWERSSSDHVVSHINPFTESPMGSVPSAAPIDVDHAVAGARRVLTDSAWADMVPEQRAGLLERLADELEARAVQTAAIVTSENGMPTSLAQPAEGSYPADVLRYFAQLCRDTPLEEWRRAHHGRGWTLVRRSPIGVVAAVTPWNYPQSLAMYKLAPALAAGCAVVLKPAPETSVDAFQLADAAEAAGLPPGVLSIVPGGRDIGEYLVAHPGVDKVAFTGSTSAGRRIGEVCGRLVRPVTLELGGKSAAIVLDDADVARVARNLAYIGLQNQGQTCHLSTRILAPHSRYAEVVDAVADMARSLTVGDPLDSATRIGPLVTARQRDRVEGYIARAAADGRVVAGGRRPAGLDQGWFVEPTVVADISPDSPPAREEIFGPVLCVMPYQTIDDAIVMANDSEYGLGGTVWTADVDRGLDVARQVATGTIGVNCYDVDLSAPFGGVKASGLGRELGPEGFAPYFALQTVFTRLTAAPLNASVGSSSTKDNA